jgi:type II secretory pathway pseudopilin PulG
MRTPEVLYAFAVLAGSFLAGGLLAGAIALVVRSQPPPPSALNAGGDQQEHRTNEKPQPEIDDGFTKNRATALPQDDSKPSKGPQKEKTAPDEKHAPTNSGRGVADWRYWPVVNTLLLTIFNGILAFVAIRQWQNMRRQERLANAALREAEETVEQMRLEQRAWICADDIQLDIFWANERPTCDFKLRNTGTTPGTLDKFGYTFQHGDNEITLFEQAIASVWSVPYAAQMVVPPGGVVVLPLESSARVDKSVFDFNKTNGVLVLLVRFEYLDVTGARRTTQCAYELQGEATNFVLYQEHNYMT